MAPPCPCPYPWSSSQIRMEELTGVWEVLTIDEEGRPFLDRSGPNGRQRVVPPAGRRSSGRAGRGPRGRPRSKVAPAVGGTQEAGGALQDSRTTKRLAGLRTSPAACCPVHRIISSSSTCTYPVVQARRLGSRGPVAALCPAPPVWPVMARWRASPARHAVPLLLLPLLLVSRSVLLCFLACSLTCSSLALLPATPPLQQTVPALLLPTSPPPPPNTACHTCMGPARRPALSPQPCAA